MLSALGRIEEQLASLTRKQPKEHYSTEEIAKVLGKAEFTVREWCRLGRINATKRLERRGGAELWSISAAEVARYKDEGLLSHDMNRNPA